MTRIVSIEVAYDDSRSVRLPITDDIARRLLPAVIVEDADWAREQAEYVPSPLVCEYPGCAGEIRNNISRRTGEYVAVAYVCEEHTVPELLTPTGPVRARLHKLPDWAGTPAA